MTFHHDPLAGTRVVSGTTSAVARRRPAFRTGFLALAGLIGLAGTFASPALADTPVLSDYGTTSDNTATYVSGTGTQINNGTPPGNNGSLTTINGSSVSGFGLGVATNVTISGYNSATGAITGGTGSKAIIYGGNQVTIHFSITGGSVTSTQTTIIGTVTAITGYGSGNTDYTLDGYNFSSQYSPIAAVVTDTISGNLESVFAGGSSMTGLSGTVSEGVVPEPSTMALAGLGALGLIGYGLRRRKARTA